MTIEVQEAYSEVDYLIARQVKLAIFDSNRTQKAIAFEVGMHPASFSKSMQGLRPWRAEEVLRIARATGADIADLLPRLDSNQQPAVYLKPQVTALPIRHLRAVPDLAASA